MGNILHPLEADSVWFPPAESALEEPNGLLAVGGDLKPERLLEAYRNGIFPWFNEGDPLLWWSPSPRAVFDVEQYRPSRSLRKRVRQQNWEFSINLNFKQVIHLCAEQRRLHEGTWITSAMKTAYYQLHCLGRAHSIEVWRQHDLIGGLYGVSIGGVFCGESMFHTENDGSKAALWALCKHLRLNQIELIDAQVPNRHLESLGATEISRSDFLNQLARLRDRPLPQQAWSPRRCVFDI